MENKDIIKKLNSAILCLMAHPDNEPDSEFADRIDDLIEIKEALIIPIVSVSEAELCSHILVEDYNFTTKRHRCIICEKYISEHN